MKKLVTIIAALALSGGIALANPSTDCGDEDVKPITLSANTQ